METIQPVPVWNVLLQGKWMKNRTLILSNFNQRLAKYRALAGYAFAQDMPFYLRLRRNNSMSWSGDRDNIGAEAMTNYYNKMEVVYCIVDDNGVNQTRGPPG